MKKKERWLGNCFPTAVYWHLLPASTCLYCASNTVPSIMHLIFFFFFFFSSMSPILPFGRNCLSACFRDQTALVRRDVHRQDHQQIQVRRVLWGSRCFQAAQDLGCVGCGYAACSLFPSSLPPLL